MSMINDMLRDLDKRQAPEVNGEGVVVQESLIEPQSSKYKKSLVIVLIVILTLVVLVGVFFQDLLGLTSKDPLQKEALTIQANSGPVVVEHDKSQPAIDIESKDVSSTTVKPKETMTQDIQLDSPVNDLALLQAESSSQQKVVIKAKVDEVSTPVVEPNTPVAELNAPVSAANTPLVEINSDIKEEATIAPKQPIIINKKEESVATLESIKKTSEIKPEKPLKTVVNTQSVESDNRMQVSFSPQALDSNMAEKALKLLSQGAEAQAYRDLYAFIGEHEQDTESRTVLASYLLQENRIAEVGDVLLNAPIQESPKLRQMKARWYAAQNELKLALYTLSSNLPDIQEYPDYYVLLAAYYQRLGWTKEARDTYSSLVEYDENIADWWAGLGLSLDRNNEKNKAIYAYQQALELTGLSTELFNFVQPRFKLLRETQATQKR